MSVTTRTISSVVIVYNPEPTVVDNIEMISRKVGQVIVVDNSEIEYKEFVDAISGFSNVIYIPLHQNKGVATGLNIGAEIAIKNGYQYLLTMDQDSCPTEDMIVNMAQVISNNMPFGILSPQYELNDGVRIHQDDAVVEIEAAMTSGNILNLEAYFKSGPFCDKLFIDYVDHEYCLRLRMNGYRILCVRNAVLQHSWGRLERKTLFGFTFFTSNYASFRYYYLVRNVLYVVARYGTIFTGFCVRHSLLVIKMCLKAMILEKGRLQRGRYIVKGCSDFLFSTYGKLKQ